MCVGFQVNESIPVFEFEMCPPCEGVGVLLLIRVNVWCAGSLEG